MSYAPDLLGLTRVSEKDLTRLLRLIHRGIVPTPLSGAGLIATGFGDIESYLQPLIGFDGPAVQRMIAIALAERRAVKRELDRPKRPNE